MNDHEPRPEPPLGSLLGQFRLRSMLAFMVLVALMAASLRWLIEASKAGDQRAVIVGVIAIVCAPLSLMIVASLLGSAARAWRRLRDRRKDV